MFGLSFFELLVVAVVALIALGPDKLPEAAKYLGKISGELKKHSDTLRREVYNAMYPPHDDFRKDIREALTFELNENEKVPPPAIENKTQEETKDNVSSTKNND
jgi:sec-independent protein translocase protein TatB